MCVSQTYQKEVSKQDFGFCHPLSPEFCLNFWSNAGVRWISWKEYFGPPAMLAPPDMYILPSSPQLPAEATPASCLFLLA